MNVLVINLTRFGDLLQTQPLLRGLHAAGHRTGLLCLESFAGAAALLDGLDYTAGLPDAAMLRALQQDWRKALGGVQGMLAQVRQEFPAQLVINTTATPAARLLARLLTPPQGRCLGFGADAQGRPEDSGLWASLLLGSVQRRSSGAFNIADMFRLLGGVGSGAGSNTLRRPAPAALAKADALLGAAAQFVMKNTGEHVDAAELGTHVGATAGATADSGINGTAANGGAVAVADYGIDAAAGAGANCAGFVGFQLGASAARRQWPVEFFAAVGDMLWRKLRMRPVLLGVAAERPLAEQYAAAASAPFIDAVGRTDIPVLAALLTRLRLLVSNDTGTMHLAAGVGLPSLAIFLATAQPWDTGPYLEDCCCLEPDLPCHPCEFGTDCAQGHACLRRITPAAVCALLQARLTFGRWADAPLPLLQGARVWLSCRDARGLLELRALTPHEQEPRTRWMRQQRLFLRHIVDSLGEDASTAPLGCTASPVGRAAVAAGDTPAHAEPAVAENMRLVPLDAGIAQGLARACAALGKAAARGHGLLRAPAPAAGQLFLEDCARVTESLHACPALEPVEALWLALSRERADNIPRFMAGLLALRAGLLLWARHLAEENAVGLSEKERLCGADVQ